MHFSIVQHALFFQDLCKELSDEASQSYARSAVACNVGPSFLNYPDLSTARHMKADIYEAHYGCSA
ncbi:hypothetical protein J1614_001809 [Plenodomus biglobosus]|nr:hypothetical protein J1614_001809 [Plenodomus biglobosus]